MGNRLAIAPAEDGDVAALTALWQAAGLTRPWNDPKKDIAFARGSTDADVLVGKREGALVASAMVGHDGHRGTVYYLAVDPTLQGEGLGRDMMAGVEAWLKARGVWKLNLMVREDNAAVIAFYKRIGYEIEPRTVMAKRLTE